MAYKKNTKNFYAEVDPKTNDAFVQQCKERGQLKNDTISAAMKVWLGLPKEIQCRFMDPNTEPTYENLLDSVEEHKMMEELRALPMNTRLEILQMVREKAQSKLKKIAQPARTD